MGLELCSLGSSKNYETKKCLLARLESVKGVEAVKADVADVDDIAKQAYFSLNVAELDYSDQRPTPPILKHFDLITGDTGDGFVGERFKKQPGSK